MPAAKRPSPGAKSGRQLAKLLGVSQPTVWEYQQRTDWPDAVRKSPPWSAADVDRIRVWREALQEDRSRDAEARKDNTEQASKVNTGLKLERLLYTRAQRKRIEGLYVERTLLDGAMKALAKAFVDGLDELERALPLQVAGLDPGQVERVVRDRVRGIRDQLANRTVLELEAVEQAAKAAAMPKGRGRPGARR